MTEPPIDTELATAIIAVYRAPLEDFISRRDALTKQLRAEKRRDEAAVAKALRKPSRMAWTLDGVVHEDPASIERLLAAIGEAQTGADLRTALETVKEAVRGVAAVGARVATRAGYPIDPNALATAVYAIIGDASAFAEFRAGRLVEVPQGGGLDLLTALSVAPPGAGTGSSPAPATVSAKGPERADPRVALAAAAGAEVRASEKRLTESRKRSERAATSLLDAKARFDAAQFALVQAQRELDARREEVERTRQLAESAAANLGDAERALADARAREAEFLV